MKYLNFKLLFFLAALALAIPPAWAETMTLTQETLGLENSYPTTTTEKTIDGITFVYTDLMNNGGRIQAKASTGVIYNKTAFPGDITRVEIIHYSTGRPTTILGSSNGTDWTQVATGSGSISGNFKDKGYRFFKITRGSNAAYWYRIEITYETGGDPTPGKTDVELEFSSSTATATAGESFTAPTLSVDPAAAISAVAYSSSNTAVATVDNNGNVTPIAAGTTTITASISNNATYNDASASYELTVEEATPQPSGVIYKKVNSTTLVDGGTYILVYEGSPAAAMGEVMQVSGSGTKGTAVTGILLDKTTNPYQVDLAGKNALILTAHATGTAGRYAFEIESGSYLNCNSASFSIVNDYDNVNAQWDIQNDGTVVSANQSSNRPILYRAGNYNLFGPYAASNVNGTEYFYAYLYQEEGAVVVERVATPTFSPAGGNFDEPQNVTISCETPNSTIYYTTDGSTPDETSTLYTGAITVDKPMTIKAIAVADGMEDSYVASATYTLPTFVTNLTDANALDKNVSFKYNGYAVVTHVNGTDAWIRDDAGTGGYLYRAIPSGLSLEKGDVLKAGWSGTKDEYKGLDEFKDVSGLEKVNTATVEPEVLTQITDADVNKYVKFVNVSESEIVDGSGNAVQLYDKFGTNYTFESGKKYDVVGIVGYYNNLQLHIISITEHGEPTISVNPTALTLKEDAQTFTVTGENLVDNVGVPNVNHVFNTTYSGDQDWGFVKDAQGKVNGTITVTYTGRELKATDTFVAGTKKSWNPVEEINESVTVTYQPDIYIVGNINNAGWNFGDGNRPMSYDEANGFYTAQLTTTDHSYFMFARKPGQNYGWQGDQNRLFFGAQTDGGNWVLGTESTGNIDINGTTGNQYHPIELPNAGEYTITVNPTDKTFTITKVIHQVETPVITPEGGNYNTIQTVSIMPVDGATMHYTTDGSEPTESSTTYEDPITVDHSMTIKAIAVMDGMTNSEVAEAAYTLPTSVNTLAAANALAKDTEFLFTGDAVVTYHNGDYTYLRDVNATAGGGLIYQSGINLAQGVVLKKGWDAKRADYRGLKEYINAINVENSGSTADYTPFDRTGVAFDDDNMNEYVTFNNVQITGKTLDEGSGKYTYTGIYTDENRVTVNYTLHNQFDVNNIEEGRTYNVTGVVTKRNENMQVYPTAVTLVQQAPELAFNPASVTVYEGVQDFPEPALTAPEGVTVQSYTSSNPDVVTVDNEGKVTIVGVGTAVITATTAENDYYLSGTATYNVEIKAKEAAGLSFGVTEPVTATYGDGTNFDEPELTKPAGLTVTYTCEPASVATVDPATGEVTIVGAGTATVTATTEGDESHNAGSATYTINVAKADAALSFAEDAIEATYGGEVPANALTNEANLDVTYTSSNEAIATVDNKGKVTIVKAGEVTITATGAANDNYNGATANYTLTIAKADATMSFAPNAVTIVEGQEFIAPTLTNEADLTVTYESSNEAVATVDKNSGAVTIAGVGETTITATGAESDNYNGTTATYTITVVAKPVVATPTFTPAAGYYNSAQNVTIACETAGVDIYYTTDGTVPTAESTKYTEAIPVGENMTIKAIAVKEGYTNSEVAEAEYVIDLPVQLAAPTFMPGSGHYTEAKEVAIACATPGAIITYKIGDGEYQTYTKPFVVDHSCTVTAKVTKDDRTVWTENQASATYTINTLNPVEITDGYYQIKNKGNDKYAHVQGRKTMTFTNDIDQQAGTVIRVQTKDNGQVQVLRSQAADLQGYADRAMRYVPEVVQMVANKLHAEGTGEILGNEGLDAIMEKFNESFDYHLYVEGELDNARIYGKTPSMQPVVDFYNENQAKVDAKLPMLEGFINDAIQKVLNKTNNHGASILVPFSLDTIWNRMGGTLIRPVDAESTMAFYHQVLTNKQYVWDFAYQTATFYLEKVKAHPKYQEMQSEFGEYSQYIDKLEQIRPDTKYFIVQNNGKVDYISEGNVDIINNAPNTYWNVEPRKEFKVNFPIENVYGGNFVTTLYTDFAYDVPKEVTAYKVKEVNENGNAVIIALNGTIPAQTPVLLVADTCAVYSMKLNIAPSALADTTGNQLHGPDYLIEKYMINTPQVESLFNFAKETFGQTFYDNYVAQYEHLMRLSAGTVNNRYFWGLTDNDLNKCTYLNENNEKDCVTRTLSVENQKLGFYSNWEAKTNQAFLVSEQFNPIKLSLRRDVNRDGKVTIADVSAQINILLALPEKPYLDVYDYDAADFNENGVIKIDDVSGMINYLLTR